MSNNVTHFFGLDYHQDSIQVCVLDGEGKILINKKVPNSIGALVVLAEQYGPVTRAAVEACAGAPCLVETLRHVHGWKIEQAHAGYVARMKQSPDKSDYTDARILADLARVDYLPVVWSPPKYIRTLRDFVRHRAALVKSRTSEKLRLLALLRRNRAKSEHKRWSKDWCLWLSETYQIDEDSRWLVLEHLETILFLNGKIETIEARLKKFTADDPLIGILMKQKNIGPITAWIMRAEIADFSRFKNGKQLSNFCGLSPRNVSSGNRQATSGLIKSGAPILRCVIIEAAQRLSHGKGDESVLFNRLHHKNGKPKCVAIAAVANRWIRKLFHVINAEVRQWALAKEKETTAA